MKIIFMMIFFKVVAILCILPLFDGEIYVLNTFDSPAVEMYDCILHEGLHYCRRPIEPIVLNRTVDEIQCLHNDGSVHSFADLYQKNVSVSTVLHQWKSSIEKVEEYIRYQENPKKLNGFICECTELKSFGKNCEYILPMGETFEQTLRAQRSMKEAYGHYVQLYGDVIRYETLECDAGLLGLDWRDICDGLQQCMAGLDEENCDLLEFNECEEDEYRCMNGMCIPEEYFLDGEFDCLDWSDEIQYYDDADCAISQASISIQCDDRICPPNEFSCGDGQCISDRLNFQTMSQSESECRNRREQNFLCETHFLIFMWTLPNGRCYESGVYNDSNENNYTRDERCNYLLKCALAGRSEAHCPCQYNSCWKFLNETCSSDSIPFSKVGIMAPYIFFFYNQTRDFFKFAPDFFRLNGTIKCHGILYNIPPDTFFPNISTLGSVEDAVCQWANKNSTCDNYQRSLTFSTICNKSRKCLSSYRIRDGFVNCVDKMDESEVPSSALQLVPTKMQQYRFRCFTDELTWLSVTALGNLEENCQNKFDQVWLGTSSKLADINCKKTAKDQCSLLRQYIKESWLSNNNATGITQQLRIPFRQYCDTFWNLLSREDENTTDCNRWWVCPEDQWRCGTGQCIDRQWVLDREWDCSDASDEDVLSDHLITNRNQRVLSQSFYMDKAKQINGSIPFSSLCDPKTEWPCLPKYFSGSLESLQHHRPCIDRSRIGDGHIDCYGGIDERNTIPQCAQSTMLGYNFQCPSDRQCIPYWHHCLGKECNVEGDDRFWCGIRKNTTDHCFHLMDAACFNGTCLSKKRCDGISDCSFGEDEYMCEYNSVSNSTAVTYRKDKEIEKKSTKQKLRLRPFPIASTVVPLTIDSTQSTTKTTTPAPESVKGQTAFWCNRGVGVKLFNDSFACFCPPQYYGEKCQYHTDRIIIQLHLDLSQSIYTIETDVKIVLKILVLFLFNEEIVTNHIFHVRPATDMNVYTKKMIHFPYSRSPKYVQYKKQRYFNRSNIINEHPYSIRIEIYERKENGEPDLNLVWQYPIYFDYLPVFRFAKVLRLTKPDIHSDPCLSNPCNNNQLCRQLQNNRSNYICLCKSHFTGTDCLQIDPLCAGGYCANQSICKPNYRGILVGNHLPFCLCFFDIYGDRCDIKHDRCEPSLCQHDGSCYSTSKPDDVACICTNEYRGKYCQFRKPELELNVNETVGHVAAVVQYYNIDFVSLNLLLSHQRVHRTLPSHLHYQFRKESAPEIILATLYSSMDQNDDQLYILSVQINASAINGTVQLNEQSRCVRIDSSMNPIMYHEKCRENVSLYCFTDGYYLCLCGENGSRVECFGYENGLDGCGECLSGGRCLKGDPSKHNEFICLCPLCYSGVRCQFNSNSFSFTLDQLFYVDLISSNKKIIVGILIFIPLFLFLLALPNNIFCLMTFVRPRCLCNGIGQYLLYMSVINQLNLAFLSCRLIHLVVNMNELHSHPTVHAYMCKIFVYLLTTSSRMVYWLSSLVAIERLYMTLFLNGRWLRKPRVARRLIYLTLIIVLLSDFYELIFVKSFLRVNNDNGGMCVMEFPIESRSIWTLYHLSMSIIHSIFPFIINLCSTLIISYVVARNRFNTRKASSNQQDQTVVTQSRMTNIRNDVHLVWQVLRENKELIIGPAITLIPQLFSLPLFIASFTLYCQNLENSWMRYVLIVCYFIRFIPPMTSFMLYVYPSSFYSSQWSATKISQWINRFRGINTPDPTSTIIWSGTK